MKGAKKSTLAQSLQRTLAATMVVAEDGEKFTNSATSTRVLDLVTQGEKTRSKKSIMIDQDPQAHVRRLRKS